MAEWDGDLLGLTLLGSGKDSEEADKNSGSSASDTPLFRDASRSSIFWNGSRDKKRQENSKPRELL